MISTNFTNPTNIVTERILVEMFCSYKGMFVDNNGNLKVEYAPENRVYEAIYNVLKEGPHPITMRKELLDGNSLVGKEVVYEYLAQVLSREYNRERIYRIESEVRKFEKKHINQPIHELFLKTPHMEFELKKTFKTTGYYKNDFSTFPAILEDYIAKSESFSEGYKTSDVVSVSDYQSYKGYWNHAFKAYYLKENTFAYVTSKHKLKHLSGVEYTGKKTVKLNLPQIRDELRKFDTYAFTVSGKKIYNSIDLYKECVYQEEVEQLNIMATNSFGIQNMLSLATNKRTGTIDKEIQNRADKVKTVKRMFMTLRKYSSEITPQNVLEFIENRLLVDNDHYVVPEKPEGKQYFKNNEKNSPSSEAFQSKAKYLFRAFVHLSKIDEYMQSKGLSILNVPSDILEREWANYGSILELIQHKGQRHLENNLNLPVDETVGKFHETYKLFLSRYAYDKYKMLNVVEILSETAYETIETMHKRIDTEGEKVTGAHEEAFKRFLMCKKDFLNFQYLSLIVHCDPRVDMMSDRDIKVSEIDENLIEYLDKLLSYKGTDELLDAYISYKDSKGLEVELNDFYKGEGKTGLRGEELVQRFQYEFLGADKKARLRELICEHVAYEMYLKLFEALKTDYLNLFKRNTPQVRVSNHYYNVKYVCDNNYNSLEFLRYSETYLDHLYKSIDSAPMTASDKKRVLEILSQYYSDSLRKGVEMIQTKMSDELKSIEKEYMLRDLVRDSLDISALVAKYITRIKSEFAKSQKNMTADVFSNKEFGNRLAVVRDSEPTLEIDRDTNLLKIRGKFIHHDIGDEVRVISSLGDVFTLHKESSIHLTSDKWSPEYHSWF